MKRFLLLGVLAFAAAAFAGDGAAAPQRVVTLAPHLTELVCAAGGCGKLVGVSAYSDYPPQAALLPQISDAATVNLEVVLGLKPDLVLAWDGGTSQETIARLRADAQPQVVRRGKLQEEIVSLEASLDDELVSLATNREERAAALSPELLTRYTAALAHAGTSGAAQIDGGKCDGCRIALSPLDLDRWKTRPEGTFMACPECGRLLLP